MKHTCETKGRSACEPCMLLEVDLWDAINRYAISVGGDPSQHVYGNTARMQAVADVGRVIVSALRLKPKSLLDWGPDRLYDDTRAVHLHGRCHAARDGECTWRECPQRKNYKSHCPLDRRTGDED